MTGTIPALSILVERRFHRVRDDLPKQAGAYALLVDLPRSLVIRIGGRPDSHLEAGRYLYCGNARGPGGIAGRVARHLRREKRARWHIDQLTSAATVLGAWAFPDQDECNLVEALAILPMPIPGFGSSDCTRCVSHLLRWPLPGQT